MDNNTMDRDAAAAAWTASPPNKEPTLATRMVRLGLRCAPNWLRHQVLGYRPEYNLRRHGPLYCGIYVTFRCNLACSWCVNPPLPEGTCLDDYEADVESVARILDHPLMRTVAHINLTGGEPLTNKNIGGIIRLIRRRGFLVGMVTNGLLLENRVDELLDAGIADVRVSMYHNTVDRLATVLPKLRGKLSVATSYIILKTELHQRPEAIEKAVQMSMESGAVGTRLNFYMPAGQHGEEELVYEDDPALADLRARLKSRFPDYRIYWRSALQRTIASGKDKTCRQPWENFHVDARGNLGLCCRYCFPNRNDRREPVRAARRGPAEFASLEDHARGDPRSQPGGAQGVRPLSLPKQRHGCAQGARQPLADADPQETGRPPGQRQGPGHRFGIDRRGPPGMGGRGKRS
jgi:organic radical activating enzyme